jgi:hypothetical protein
MCVVQPHAAVKVHESERDLHTLHTFEHRLNRQGKGKTKKIGRKRATVAPYLAASSLRSSFASTSSPLSIKAMERGLGGKKDTGYLYKGPPLQLRQT